MNSMILVQHISQRREAICFTNTLQKYAHFSETGGYLPHEHSAKMLVQHIYIIYVQRLCTNTFHLPLKSHKR